MTEIPLFNDRGTVLVDDEDVPSLSRFRWTLMRSAHHRIGYAASRTDGKTVLMHRFLLRPPSGLVIDHINGNSLDNRRANLRVCTSSENAAAGQNRNMKRAISGFKGVYRCATGRYQVTIHRGTSWKSFGRFSSAEEAARAHDDAARKIWGRFARLNFPDMDAP